MVTILTEPAYSESMWCKSLYGSLTERLRQKRIPFCEMYDTLPQNSDAVFIIAADYNWIKATLLELNHAGIKPILICNQAETILGCNYSCVCSDITGSMKYLLDNLKSDGKTRVALYGVNTSSISDIGRVDGLFAQKDGIIDSMQIFTNDGSLQSCYRKFVVEADNFDAVICFNDFAAVSLIRNLEADGEDVKLSRLKILSCCQTKISSCYRDRITSINMNLEQYGKAAVYIYNALKKHTYLSEMTVKVLWSLDSNIVSENRKNFSLNLVSSSDTFYKDKELSEMLIVDKILNSTDDVERKIIDCLLNDNTYEQIAEHCFLTVSGVKYRINKIVSYSGAANKNQIINLFKKYIK